MKLSRIKEVSLFVGVIGVLVLLASSTKAQPKQTFTVWLKTDACSVSRQHWLAVAQDNPGQSGLGGWINAPGSRYTDNFTSAIAQMDVLRMADNFREYCCRFDVWQNPETKAMTILESGKNPGGGFTMPVNSNICCEDAALITGVDTLGCTTLEIGSVPGAVVQRTAPGVFVSLTGTITIPDVPPVVISATTGGGGPTRGKMEFDIDRPGQDFQNFDLPSADPALCEGACSQNPQCKAWTYVKPNTTQGSNPRCWLKSGVPSTTPSSCCVSGVKIGASTGGGSSGGSGGGSGDAEVGQPVRANYNSLK